MGLYEYVAGDPLWGIDPWGLLSWDRVKRGWDRVKDGLRDMIDDGRRGIDAVPAIRYIVPVDSIYDLLDNLLKKCWKEALICAGMTAIDFTPGGKVKKFSAAVGKPNWTNLPRKWNGAPNHPYHWIKHASRKEAKDAARNRGKGKPVKHPDHYHPGRRNNPGKGNNDKAPPPAGGEHHGF